MSKKILIAVFIFRTQLNRFLEQIDEDFGVSQDKVFVFENLEDGSQFILTFYVEIPIDERINLRKYFKNALIVHKKRKSFYTINALNNLIEKEHKLEKGNIDYKRWQIDWSNYEDRLIINSNNKLVLIPLKRFFS